MLFFCVDLLHPGGDEEEICAQHDSEHVIHNSYSAAVLCHVLPLRLVSSGDHQK